MGKKQDENKQDYSSMSPDVYRRDSASPQGSDCRIMAYDNSLSSGSASNSPSSPIRLPIKKRKIYITNDSCNIEDSAKDDHQLMIQHDDKENDGIDHPIVNSKGEMKKYRCKHCPYEEITKREFWNHAREHIDPEKLIECSLCPFVTEYKHHFQFHFFNHFNVKPFKCDKCDYSGVSKHMLESHLKSHSNVRKYRCAECDYASKYFHQLKVHLRKSQHKEGYMLNDDRDDATSSQEKLVIRTEVKRLKRKRTNKVEKDEPPLKQVANVVNGYPAVPLQSNVDNNVMRPISPTVQVVMPNISSDQIALDICAQTSESLPSYDHIDTLVDLSEKASVPLDLSKNYTPSMLWNCNYNAGHFEEYKLDRNSTDVYQQIQQIRMNLENMYRYVQSLVQNFQASS